MVGAVSADTYSVHTGFTATNDRLENMTTIAFIALNAVLGTAVAFGLLRLLVHGIISGREVVEAEIRSLPSFESERLAA